MSGSVFRCWHQELLERVPVDQRLAGFTDAIQGWRRRQMITGIHRTTISTGNFERSLKFYRDPLGFAVTFELECKPGDAVLQRLMDLGGQAEGHLALLKWENAFVDLFEFTSPTPQLMDPRRPVCDHGMTHLCLPVTGIDAEHERLEAAGMHFHCPPLDFGP